MKKRKLELLMAVLMILFALLFSNMGAQFVTSQKVREKKIVVIDSGHGGVDSGKVSVLDDKEKDINLSIAKKLAALLKKKGYRVIMTRTQDKGLYDENASNKKVQDMRARCSLIESSGAQFAISIHQNSYHEENVKGAQVFYYEASVEGKQLAECIQKAMVEELDPSNTRVAKSNSSYYLLRKTKVPTVIVECGFLSNYEEAEKLASNSYQKKAAKAILKGIERYRAADRSKE